MPRRVIIHAGFHKTGTSTVQATLRDNRVAMKKHVALRLRWHMKDIVTAARGYSMDQDPLTLVKVQTRFGAMVNDLPGMPRRTLILSAEELLGHLPGRDELMDYAAAPVLLYAYWEIFKAKYPLAEVMIYLSTRGPEAWLKSAYWEHVKSSNMTLDFDAFATKFHRAALLDDMAADVASRVPVQVHTFPLENTETLRLGPADPLLQLCDLPKDVLDSLSPATPTNVKADEAVLKALLEANRLHTSPAKRKAAKDAILAEAGET